MEKLLVSTLSGNEYPFERLEEFAENGESLEVKVAGISNARVRKGDHLLKRYAEFLPFDRPDERLSMGEGNTPLLRANEILARFTGIEAFYIKNETMNPTWSFKDRGSLACMFMSREMREEVTATISTGNMGHSISAYAARAGMKAMVFVPGYTPEEKIKAMQIHGARVVKVEAPDYAQMKKEVLHMAGDLGLRIVSGNGPIRVEGYKLAAFELFEQFQGTVPDYIAVPTSACGHIRGIFKGFTELKKAGYIHKLPRMIIVQAEQNSPIVTAIKQGKKEVVPFHNFTTVAEAITTGNPMGGDEIIEKAYRYGWLAESVSEDEIIKAQRKLAESGLFVEPASATSLFAVRKLIEKGKIQPNEKVVMMATGSGLKDFEVFSHHSFSLLEAPVSQLKDLIKREF